MRAKELLVSCSEAIVSSAMSAISREFSVGPLHASVAQCCLDVMPTEDGTELFPATTCCCSHGPNRAYGTGSRGARGGCVGFRAAFVAFGEGGFGGMGFRSKLVEATVCGEQRNGVHEHFLLWDR